VDSRATTTDDAEVKLQLQRVLSSRPIEKAQRSQRFLRYIVEAALNEDRGAVKEYAIALKVFDRDDGYDPSIDARRPSGSRPCSGTPSPILCRRR
jgi:hypothetical protein